MAVVATITDQVNLGSRWYVEGTLTFSGNYVTGGEVPTYPGLKTGKSTAVRLAINALAGYLFSYDPATGKIMIFQDATPAAAAPLPQLAAAGYPAGLTGVTTYFQGWFKKP